MDLKHPRQMLAQGEHEADFACSASSVRDHRPSDRSSRRISLSSPDGRVSLPRIGCDFRIQFDRLKLIANNSRFLILPEGPCPNVGLPVLGQLERRVASDWQQRFGHPDTSGLRLPEDDRQYGRQGLLCSMRTTWPCVKRRDTSKSWLQPQESQHLAADPSAPT